MFCTTSVLEKCLQPNSCSSIKKVLWIRDTFSKPKSCKTLFLTTKAFNRQGEKRLPTEPPLLRVQTLAVESLSWFCLFRTNDVFPHEFKWPYRLSRDNCCFAKNAVIYIISRDPETLVTLRILMNASLKFYSLILKHSPNLRTHFKPIRSFLIIVVVFFIKPIWSVKLFLVKTKN